MNLDTFQLGNKNNGIFCLQEHKTEKVLSLIGLSTSPKAYFQCAGHI